MRHNLLLLTDAYKFGGHSIQYPEGTTKVYSYLISRSNKKYKTQVFFGLQYYLKKYLEDARIITTEAEEYYKMIFKKEVDKEILDKWISLSKFYYNKGYLPIIIKAVPEGTVLPVKNVLMTIENTHPEFYWVVGYVESLLLKVWNTITVATYSREMKKLCKRYLDETSDNVDEILPYMVHDFGYRGCSSEETAALSGAAHLINFKGTDTVPAVQLLIDYYQGASFDVGHSVPATEHSVMCAYGQENEIEAFRRMLKLYPTGIISIVSDTYDLWNVLTNIAFELKDEILARDGKVVFRPDSGNPVKIICGGGDKHAWGDEMRKLKTFIFDGWDFDDINWEHFGCLRILDAVFGHTLNSKGYKVLNEKVGLIYGDGMYYEHYETMLQTMKEMGYATSNLVIGVGGLLLQQHNRDDLGITFKASYCEVNGEPRNLLKCPVTDVSKKSLSGRLALLKDNNGNYYTKENATREDEVKSLLETIYCGEAEQKHLFYSYENLYEIRKRCEVV